MWWSDNEKQGNGEHKVQNRLYLWDRWWGQEHVVMESDVYHVVASLSLGILAPMSQLWPQKLTLS